MDGAGIAETIAGDDRALSPPTGSRSSGIHLRGTAGSAPTQETAGAIRSGEIDYVLFFSPNRTRLSISWPPPS